jgi:hypothetical protein
MLVGLLLIAAEKQPQILRLAALAQDDSQCLGFAQDDSRYLGYTSLGMRERMGQRAGYEVRDGEFIDF